MTHRGNRRQAVFLRAQDRRIYKSLLGEYSRRHGLEIWSYCLMSNHVHLLVVPQHVDSLAHAIGRAHCYFSRLQNERNDWTGHLWANRFYSSPLDEDHLWAAVRYVELNPVRAGLVERAEEFEWSSAANHAGCRADDLLSTSRPFPGDIDDWSKWLREGLDEPAIEALRRNTSTGRPTGSEGFVRAVETQLGRPLLAPKLGRPRSQLPEGRETRERGQDSSM